MRLTRGTGSPTRRIEVTGPASPNLAWARYENPMRWTWWAPHLTSVDTEARRIEPGATGTVYAIGVPARFIVLTTDPAARTWSWEVRLGPVTLHLVHDLTPTDQGGCRAGLDITGPSVVTVPYLPLAAWALRRLTHLPDEGATELEA